MGQSVIRAPFPSCLRNFCVALAVHFLSPPKATHFVAIFCCNWVGGGWGRNKNTKK